MRRPKRSSVVIKKAGQRAAACCSIDPALDLGSSLTIVAYKAKIADTQAKLDTYNTQLSLVDSSLTALEKAEAQLGDMSDRMLKGVSSKFGPDSEEYEKAGGTRKSTIVRRPRKAKNVTPLDKAA